MSLRDINKRYIDEVLEYYITEVYNRLAYEAAANFRYLEKKYIEIILDKFLDELLKKSFVINWRVNVNLLDKADRRDAKLAGVLDDIEDEGSFIEVLYQMQDRAMYSVRISEEELIKHRDGFNR